MLFYVYLVLSLAAGILTGLCLSCSGAVGTVLLILALWLGFFLALTALHAAFLAVLGLFIDDEKPVKRIRPFYQYVVGLTMALVLKLVWVKVDITGRELMPSEGRFLLVCNHRFLADPLALMALMKKPELAFIMKKEVKKMGFIGKLGHAAGGLYVDRNDARSAVTTINDAVEILDRGETSLCVFPEGGTNHDRALKPFRNGAFKIATRAQVPIVVAAMRNTDYILKRFPFRSTVVPVTVCGVVDRDFVASHTTVEVGTAVRELMERGLDRISAEYEVYGQ